MTINTEARIRDRAYSLWEAAGRPDGHDKEFWETAERELANQSDLDVSAEQAEPRLAPVVAGLPVH